MQKDRLIITRVAIEAHSYPGPRSRSVDREARHRPYTAASAGLVRAHCLKRRRARSGSWASANSASRNRRYASWSFASSANGWRVGG